jgi:hypothetical protein
VTSVWNIDLVDTRLKRLAELASDRLDPWLGLS